MPKDPAPTQGPFVPYSTGCATTAIVVILVGGALLVLWSMFA